MNHLLWSEIAVLASSVLFALVLGFLAGVRTESRRWHDLLEAFDNIEMTTAVADNSIRQTALIIFHKLDTMLAMENVDEARATLGEAIRTLQGPPLQ